MMYNLFTGDNTEHPGDFLLVRSIPFVLKDQAIQRVLQTFCRYNRAFGNQWYSFTPFVRSDEIVLFNVNPEKIPYKDEEIKEERARFLERFYIGLEDLRKYIKSQIEKHIDSDFFCELSFIQNFSQEEYFNKMLCSGLGDFKIYNCNKVFLWNGSFWLKTDSINFHKKMPTTITEELLEKI